MRKLLTISVACACFLYSAPSSQAQGIPVFDSSSVAQAIAQLNHMVQEYQTQLEQLEQAAAQTNAVTGSRSMGDLVNDTAQQELRRYLPNNWQDTMNILESGNVPGSAAGTQGIYSDLHQQYDPISGADVITAEPDGTIAKAFDRRSGTTFATMAASEQAYNNIASRIETYEQLMTELNATPDLKASTDLQARIAAENGLILNELVRLNAMQMQQKAAQDAESITNYKRSTTANKFDPVKAAESFKAQ